jgi:aspartyl protease family protein
MRACDADCLRRNHSLTALSLFQSASIFDEASVHYFSRTTEISMPLTSIARRDTMKLMPSIGLAILLTIGAGLPGFVSLSEAQLAQPVPVYAMTELDASDNGHYMARARINNSGINVMVDTGASVVALTWKDAEKIGLKPSLLDFNVSVSTANGEGKAARVMLDEVEIDNVSVENVQGLVMQKDALGITLLGMSYLGRLESFSVTDGKLILEN